MSFSAERRKKKRKLNKLKIKPFNVPPKKKQKLHTINSKQKCNLKHKRNNTSQKHDHTKIDDDDTLNHMEPMWNEIFPNDVEIAMHKLQDEFPKNVLNPFPLLVHNENKIYAIPVILETQIYSLIEDHTFVDQCIDKLKRANEIRHFRVNIDKTKRKKMIKHLCSNIDQNRNELIHKQCYDNGVIDLFVYTDDYNAFITNNIQSHFTINTEYRNKIENEFCFKILDNFMNKLMPNYFNHIISKQQIMKYLIDDNDKNKEKIMDKVISLLINCGLITQKLEHIYSFSYPKSSKITRSMDCGRKEIISFIWKKRYHQVLKKEIVSHKMKRSCLDSMFHFRDLLGAQIIKEVECPLGFLVQMT